MPVFGLGRKKARPAVGDGARAPRARTGTGLPEARLIPGDGDAELLALLTVAESRDWTGLRGGLSRYSGDDLTNLIGKMCAKTPELSDWLPEAVGSESDDALARALLGAESIERAWRVRTGKYAQHVSQDQFREFHTILREAEEHLYRSAELDPKSAAPWYSLLISGRGLQVDLEVQQRRFESLVQRSPGHFGAHRQMLEQLCRKWSGSHERMHAFATDAMRGPHGDQLGVLIPIAYYEHFRDLGKDSPERRFITSAESRAELQEAADRTLLRPGFAPARNPYLAANAFSWAFCAAEMWPQARAALRATEGVVVSWAGFADPVANYNRQCALAYKNF
jgi:hypothetical protein